MEKKEYTPKTKYEIIQGLHMVSEKIPSNDIKKAILEEYEELSDKVKEASLGVNPQKKVLIIEDEEDVAKPLYSILNEKGYHYKLVKDGKEALEIIPLYEPDMAIVDNSLPVLSGQEVIYNVRKNPEYKEYSNLYLITTGQGFSKEALEMCDNSLKKPIDLYEFMNAVEKATSHNRN